MNTVSFLLALVVSQLIPTLSQDSLFSERPTSVNASLGTTAVFRCLPSQGGPGDVAWRVNGIYFNRLRADDIYRNTTTTKNGTHNCLYIQASEERNNTVIECVLLNLGDGKETSNATLTVQGTLASVGGLTAVPREGSLHLTWHPPFTLDITDSQTPDILYCINIYNITQNSHDLIQIKCNLTQPEFVFRVISPSPCDQFKFQVIPVNDAGNGTSNNITGYLFEAPTLQVAPAIEVAIISDDIIVKFSFLEISHICVWRLYVNSSDDLPAISPQLPDISGGLNTTDFNITISSNTLPIDRNYSIAVEGKNSAGKGLSKKLRLSTYDVQKTTSISDSGKLIINCVFAANSSALGWLSIVGAKSSGNESFHVARRSNNTLSIGNLDSDNYTVVTFDIEQNGLPGNRAAYVEDVELLNGLKTESDLPGDTGGTGLEFLNNGTLCFICNFTSGCIVLIHSTSIPQHLVHTTTNSSEGPVPICVNATNICSTGNCTAAVYKNSRDGIVDQPEPVFTRSQTGHEPMVSPVPTGAVPSSWITTVTVTLSVAVLLTVFAAVVIGIACRKKKTRARVMSQEAGDSRSENAVVIPLHIKPKKGTDKSLPECASLATTKCQSSMLQTDMSASYSPVNNDGKENQSSIQYTELETLHGKLKPPALDDRVQYPEVLPQQVVTESDPPPPPLPALTVETCFQESTSCVSSSPQEQVHDQTLGAPVNNDMLSGVVETTSRASSPERTPSDEVAKTTEHLCSGDTANNRPKTARAPEQEVEDIENEDNNTVKEIEERKKRSNSAPGRSRFKDEDPSSKTQSTLAWVKQ